MAGSLGCQAIAVLSGREDWHRRALVIVFASWGGKLALYGNSPVPNSVVHVRFGPDNTNAKR